MIENQHSIEPNHIKQPHWKEWITDSAVDPFVTSLNVISLSGFDPYDRLLYGLPNSERRNDGRLRDKWLNRYAHCEQGGWWVAGVDVLTGEDSQWGHFKANTPRRKGFDPKSNAKIIKYEAPPKVPTEIFALKVNFYSSWNLIRNRDEKEKNAWIERFEKAIASAQEKEREEEKESCDKTQQGFGEFFLSLRSREYATIDRLFREIWHGSKPGSAKSEDVHRGRIKSLVQLEDRGFWFWVKDNPQIPLLITEGSKKPGALITANYVALAVPGVFSGYRQPKNEWGQKIGNPYLIPQLKVFASKGREIIFCFDQDSKPQTVANIRIAIARTGKLFEYEGCKVSVISWDYPEKGVDDLIAARGVDCFDAAYTARTRLSKFTFNNFLDLSRYEPLKINERYLGENLSASGDAQVIALRSPKGSNKTGWIADRVQEFIQVGKPVLVITHRIQLAKALCNRFGIDHIEEIRTSQTKGVLGYGLCIDSLHPLSQAGFAPLEWNEAIVILDECEQVIWHMLDSTTCQDNRVAIINNFQILLQTVIATGGKIYLSDADLSQIALDYVLKLIGKPVKTWVVHNTYKPTQKRQLISYTGGDAREIIASLVKKIEAGDKALIHATGQKAKSKWGTINLESYLKEKFPSKRILRIDRESVCEPGHPAMGCISNLDNILATYDIAICSPVIETGVSIDLKGHFDSVWAIAQGVQTVDAVCQAIARLRDDVPRHIWAKTTAKGNRIGNGTTSVPALMRSQHELTKTNINLLQQATLDNWDEFENFDSNFSQDSLRAWARRACAINAGKTTYRESIIEKLLDEGYVISSPDGDDLGEAKTVNNEIKETAKKNYSDYCQAIPKVESPSFSELEQLNNKKSKTPAERLIQRKGNLEKAYGVEVTSELVEKDDKGWYSQLQLHYYLTVGNIYLAQRDRSKLAKLQKQGDGKAFKPDINKSQLAAVIKTLQFLNIEQFLAPNATFTKDSLAQWFEMVLKFRFDIKTLLGVSIHPEKDTAIAVAQRLLKKLGLKLEFLAQLRVKGKHTRIYLGCKSDFDMRSLVFQNWLERDERYAAILSEEINAA